MAKTHIKRYSLVTRELKSKLQQDTTSHTLRMAE